MLWYGIGIAQCLGFGTYLAISVMRPIPSDDEIRANFIEHRAAFEQLKNMILKQPKHYAVGLNEIDGFTRERDGSFRPLLNEPGECTYTKEAALRASGLTLNRYELFVTLLKEIGAYQVRRLDNSCVEISIFSNIACCKDVVFSVNAAPIVTNTKNLVSIHYTA